jgi:hypothetical protein
MAATHTSKGEGAAKKRFPLLFALLLVCCSSALAAAADECLSYEPVEVTLTGKTSLKVFPGPPNYESVKQGDRPEPAWLLHLAKPICIKADPKNGDNLAMQNVSVIHLVLRDKQFKQHRNLRKKGAVKFTGRLFHSFTGHHHADVLMWVTGMQGSG